MKLYCTSILDYPESMSQYERESRAAEAKLAAERKIKKDQSVSRIQNSPLPNRAVD